MIFLSVTFLFFFLPVCIGGYCLLPRRFRNGWLRLASLAFYTWGRDALVVLLITSTAVDYPKGASWAPLRRVLVLFAVMLGWVLFRSPTITSAFEYLGAMFTSGGIMPDAITDAIDTRATIAMGIGIASAFLPGNFVVGLLITSWQGIRGAALRVAEVTIALPYAMIIVASGSFSPFLYYQF